MPASSLLRGWCPPTWVACAVAALVCFAVAGSPANGATVRRTVDKAAGLSALLTEKQEIFLEARPGRGEGLLAFARRLTGSDKNAPAISRANRNVKVLLSGTRYRVPLDLLTPQHQLATLKVLFKQDRLAKELARRGLSEPTKAPVKAPPPPPAPAVAEPAAPVAVRPAMPLTEEPVVSMSPTPSPGSRSYRLEYGRDDEGEYAIYRLKPREALYSSVVVRFTGRILAPDVNALALEIARRSGIEDVTDIPVGFRVKVPFDLLLPEYLPLGHPRRLEYEQSLADSARYTNQVRSADLSGVTVILDSGHGGEDVGASFDGVWESLYVYDITLRIRQLLAERTAAEVVTTTRAGSRYEIIDRDVLPFSRNHHVLTDPPYPVDAVTGLHLRWYFANSVLNRAVRAGGEAQRVVFVSLHADSLHPSIRGAMAYIPAADLRAGSFGRKGAAFQARAEWREQPSVSFDWKERVESEGLSRELARHMIRALERRGIAIHPFKPIRERIIRQRGAFVPAVLRYNAVPAKLLLEVCNLANAEDRRLLQTRAFRQEIAEAVVDSLLAYYGEEGASKNLQMAVSQ